MTGIKETFVRQLGKLFASSLTVQAIGNFGASG
jgi:hypothetical protein